MTTQASAVVTRYAIVDYLPESARRAAAMERYNALPSCVYGYKRRTMDGHDPLAVALGAPSMRGQSALSATLIAKEIVRLGWAEPGAITEIFNAAQQFIDGWDGLIGSEPAIRDAQLAAVLEVS